MRFSRLAFPLFVLAATAQLLLTPARSFGQFVVDCTGNTPGAYTTINSVIPLLTNGSVVRVTGPCTENVTIAGLSNLRIGTPFGQTQALQGNLTLKSAQNVFIQGLSITNPGNNGTNGDGIDINFSTAVTLDSCSSSNNLSYGLNITNSTVTVQNNSAFSNNGNYGINVTGGASDLNINGFSAPVTVSNNTGMGIELQDGVMEVASGNLIVTNNKTSSNGLTAVGFATGYGIQLLGHARAILYDWSPSTLPPNQITGNQTGGISIEEGSEIGMGGLLPSGSGSSITNIIDNNGPVGILVGMNSQLTVYNGVQITNHPDAAISVFGHSQVFIDGPDQISSNGAGPGSAYPTHAAVRVDGNSEAYIRGGQITQNGGPGFFVLGNSSIDLSGATLSSNLGGSVRCDSSSWLITDQANAPMAFGCRIPEIIGPGFPHQFGALSRPPLPDVAKMKAQQNEFQRLISSF